MEYPGNSRSISRDQNCASSSGTNFVSHSRQSTKLCDILNCEKPVEINLSYADFHYEITKHLDPTLPKYVGSQQTQVLDRTVSKEDELVRYMSNLPSYLEKGKNYQDKALNVGVLDWRRLEKWQCSQKQMPGKQSVYSPSSSTNSIFSTDGSSAHSSRGLSCSPAHQRVHHLSLQSKFEESPKETHVRDAKSSSGRYHSFSPVRQNMLPPVTQYHSQKVCTGGRTSPDIDVFDKAPQKFQDSPVIAGNNLRRQQRFFGAIQCETRESDLKSVSELGKRQTTDKYEVGAPWKGKSKAIGMESANETIRSQESKLVAPNKGYSVREKSGDVFMPRDLSKHKCSSLTAISSLIADGRLSVDPCQKSILVRNILESDLPENDHLKKQLEASESSLQHANAVKSSSQHSNIPQQPTTTVQSPCKNNAQCIRGAPQTSHVLSFPARILSSPSKCWNAEEKKPYAGPKSDIAVQDSDEFVARRSSASVPKVRNQSPIRRLGSAMGKMIKNAGSRDNSPVRWSSSKECVATKSVSEGEVSSDKLCTTNNNRGRSSPLRRLLDPLLKPRASNCSEPSKKLSSSMAGTINSSNESSDLCVGHSEKVNMRPASGCTSLLQAQALLQVSFKNGLPLFTFAIDNESDILAATVRKSSVPGKGHHSSTYTFFTIHEVKKRSGIWLNKERKGDGPGYVPNVVAQMKVSDSPSLFTKSDNADPYIIREFDLFAVDGDQYGNDFHPTNELAAIVVTLSNTTENDRKDGEFNYNWLDLAQDSCAEQDMRSANSCNHSLKSRNFRSTVILPGGVHTVPSKGELSTLAERWRSGGSCDCGGWDLGCQLRVYTNKKEHERRTVSSGTFLNKKNFQLFSQGNQDSQPILSLAPFKEKIYSVEFSSSLSLLQAFAICMSYIDCRRPPELPEPSVSIRKITESSLFEVATRTNTSNQSEAPTKYLSNPPHSPVGRV